MTLEKLLLEYCHPVGSYYWSDDSTDPGEIYGGTWEQIKDRFLLSAGGSYAAGSTGGEAAHTLTVSEMPAHAHTQHVYCWDSSVNVNTLGIGSSALASLGSSGHSGSAHVDAASTQDYKKKTQGGGAAHNNMPPYRTAYLWRRTA